MGLKKDQYVTRKQYEGLAQACLDNDLQILQHGKEGDEKLLSLLSHVQASMGELLVVVRDLAIKVTDLEAKVEEHERSIIALGHGRLP